MLTQEREITQVAYTIIVVVAAGIVTSIPFCFVVRLTKERKIREIDKAVNVDVRAHDDYVNADRNSAGRYVQDSLSLAGDIHSASENAAATGDTAGERCTSVGVRQ